MNEVATTHKLLFKIWISCLLLFGIYILLDEYISVSPELFFYINKLKVVFVLRNTSLIFSKLFWMMGELPSTLYCKKHFISPLTFLLICLLQILIHYGLSHCYFALQIFIEILKYFRVRRCRQCKLVLLIDTTNSHIWIRFQISYGQ